MFDLTTRDIKYISGVGPQKAGVLNKELEIPAARSFSIFSAK